MTAAGLPDRLRLPLTFDAATLAADVAALESDTWVAHFVRQNYDGEWSAFPLRAKAGATHPIMMIYSDPAADTFEDTPFLAACPAIRTALGQLHCPLRSVRLMRLGPGSIIKEHCDPALDAALGTVRLHVPVATNPDVDFRLNGQRVVMAPGETWYLRLTDPHSVANRGLSPRVHLVIDADVNEWLEALLVAAHKSADARQTV